MKRLLMTLGMVLSLSMLAIHAEPAKAQSVPTLPTGCTAIVTSSTYWPNGNYSANCGGTPADATSLNSSLNNTQAFGFKNLAKQGVQLFLFPTPAAYTSALGANAASVPSGAWSFTKFDSNNRPIHIAVFEKNSASVAIPANTLAHYSVREAGRSIDTLLGFITKYGIVTNPYPSNSTQPNYVPSKSAGATETITAGPITYGNASITVGGTITVGDTLTIQTSGGGLISPIKQQFFCKF